MCALNTSQAISLEEVVVQNDMVAFKNYFIDKSKINKKVRFVRFKKNKLGEYIRINELITPISLACIHDRVEMVRFLLNHKANPNLKSDDGQDSILHSNTWQILSLILDKSNKDLKEYSIDVRFLISRNRVDLIKLIDKKINLEKFSKDIKDEISRDAIDDFRGYKDDSIILFLKYKKFNLKAPKLKNN